MKLAVLITVVNVSFFFIGGSLLHWLFHRLPSERLARWKHQPARQQTRAMILEKLPLVVANAILLNALIGIGVAVALGRFGSAYWHPRQLGVPYLIFSTVLLFPFYHLALYYFHRAMHAPRMFRALHHLHHKYKAPMFLDALYEHPLEALYGAVVVTAPLFLFPVCVWGFFVFFAVVGVHEIIDHAGIDLNVPLLSRSKHHDEHHRRSRCYYGQLLSLLDDAHGTTLPPTELERKVA